MTSTRTLPRGGIRGGDANIAKIRTRWYSVPVELKVCWMEAIFRTMSPE